jgi:CRISPR-associated endonuclease/helicase Cas3
MARIADSLDGLVDDYREPLESAARLHDEGKRHPRFQGRMGAQDGDEPLAKPRPGHVPDRGDGWRHEQLSAAVAWAKSGEPLTTVLVAAHHGTGRPLFDRGARDLLDGWADDAAVVRSAMELFGSAGSYEQLREDVESELGVHGLGYLEALLRCADSQVSREGGL